MIMQELSYKKLEFRVEKTYSETSNAINKNALYDSYIKAFVECG